MRLDRNTVGVRRNKYALVKRRELERLQSAGLSGLSGEWIGVNDALTLLTEKGIIDWGEGDDDFFVIRLKDRYAANALHVYADAAAADGEFEYANDVTDLACRAGPSHPKQKKPD